MHPSVLAFARRVLQRGEFAGRCVLEAGSYNVNGSIREVVTPFRPHVYLGIDPRPGPGVDVAMDMADAVVLFREGAFDAVLCCETLEHVEAWRSLVLALKVLVAEGGIVFLTTRGPGFPYHEYPGDYWRFSCDDIRAAFADFTIDALEPDPQHPGVLLKARKPAGWEAGLDLRAIAPLRITP